MNTEAVKHLAFIFSRRSIRVYRDEPVGEPAIRTLLEAAMAAPSAVGQDPWRFVVVRRPETLVRLAEALPHGQMIGSAPVGLVVCGDLHAAHDRQLSYLLQDCSAAIENLLLAASALGLGACWLGIHPREQRLQQVREILGIPAHVIPVAAIALGYPGEEKPPRTRFNADYVRYERW